MDLKQLKYFLTIAEEGQITSAAKRLHIAQPPLSQQLKNLENELGIELIKRGSRHIELTDAGKILRDRASQILNLSDSTVNEILDLKKGFSGTLKIGTVSSSGTILLNSRMNEFVLKYPDVKFELYEGNTFKVLDLLDEGIIEIGIVRTPFNNSSYNCIYAEKEPMIAIMNKKYDWNESKNVVSIKELKNKPLILYRRFEQLIKDCCIKENFEPNIFCKNDDARTTILWANAGFGIGILPKSAYNLASNNNLIYKEIQNTKLTTQISAIYKKNRYLSTVAQNFINEFSLDWSKLWDYLH